ncbi:hypothetical protein [Flavobacterium acetivorans]|uniref:hypothetical protein n=1 Tax=Flavobacterium acetivorans TaxID=2893883 RepID=UPI001E658207|nr:hypothetical protein [Flavobacterium sp. F-29]UFH36438.1 hypothetical protein LNP19_05190 [Flavobacterium sp. F-29]
MSLPINGRIAIIDDQLKHAEPLMKILSKNQLPHTYFSGDILYLPEETDNSNDIRLLFLDINLIDNSEHSDKILKSKLVPVINRVISQNNYPYAIVFWSRHEHHRALLENDIFENDLKTKKPIGYLSATKSDFFDLDGNHTEEFDKNIDKLFKKINDLFHDFYSYKLLLNWENLIHNATDSTLQEIFSIHHQKEGWKDNSNCIISKLGNAYLGNYYKEAGVAEKNTASFISFNSVFKDTIDSTVYNFNETTPQELTYDTNETDVTEILTLINEKLNLSKNIVNTNDPGNIIFYDDDKLFKQILNKILSLFKLKNLIKSSNNGIEESVLKKAASKKFEEIKTEIKSSWKKIGVVVTPICDYVQKNNHIYDRIVNGLLIDNKYKEYVDTNSEAIFICPFTIKIEDIEYLLILDFRYFTTTDLTGIEKSKVKYRIRQELLSEIQSKLSRHINRQGILFVN